MTQELDDYLLHEISGFLGGLAKLSDDDIRKPLSKVAAEYGRKLDEYIRQRSVAAK